jgi:hypothetical protein
MLLCRETVLVHLTSTGQVYCYGFGVVEYNEACVFVCGWRYLEHFISRIEQSDDGVDLIAFNRQKTHVRDMPVRTALCWFIVLGIIWGLLV